RGHRLGAPDRACHVPAGPGPRPRVDSLEMNEGAEMIRINQLGKRTKPRAPRPRHPRPERVSHAALQRTFRLSQSGKRTKPRAPRPRHLRPEPVADASMQ